jgi:hypothetical protein
MWSGPAMGELIANIAAGIVELVSLVVGKFVLALSGRKSSRLQATLVGLGVCTMIGILLYLLLR